MEYKLLFRFSCIRALIQKCSTCENRTTNILGFYLRRPKWVLEVLFAPKFDNISLFEMKIKRILRFLWKQIVLVLRFKLCNANNAIWLNVPSHVTYFKQSEIRYYFSVAKLCYFKTFTAAPDWWLCHFRSSDVYRL